jgi:hypothetical protein
LHPRLHTTWPTRPSVSIAIALTSTQPLLRVWNDNFLWTAPNYFVGAAVAVVSATIVDGANQWLLPILIPPVYLTFRSYKVYLGRIEAEQRHTKEVTELHVQAQQALKFAQQSESKLRDTLGLLKQSEERYALAAAGSNDGPVGLGRRPQSRVLLPALESDARPR